MGAREFRSIFDKPVQVSQFGPHVSLRAPSESASLSRLFSPSVARELAQALLDVADAAEKPPVTVFKPGDVVRYKPFPGLEYVVLEQGHVLTRGLGTLPAYRTSNEKALPVGVTEFTSEHFELVSTS